MENNNEIKANIEEVVNHLTGRIAQLETDNAVLKSLVNQYKTEVTDTKNSNE